MDEEIDIDVVVDAQEDDTPLRDNKRESAKPRAVGYKTLGLAALIAAILGSLGGGAISKFTATPAANIGPLKTQIETVVAENKSLKAQLLRLERETKKKRPETQPETQIDFSEFDLRLKALEDTEKQAEETPVPTIDPELLTRLEALQKEGSAVIDLSEINQRLDKAETQLSNLEKYDDAALITKVKSNLLADETFRKNRMVKAEVGENLIAREINTPALPLPEFPAQAILLALDETQISGNWLKKTINKRITVQSDDNPRYLVELIQLDLNEKNYSGAVVKFDKLPEAAKIPAQDWRQIIANIKSIEDIK